MFDLFEITGYNRNIIVVIVNNIHPITFIPVYFDTHDIFIYGLKVFMDARMPVTHKEGDRYPLGPPYILIQFPSSSAVEQQTVNLLVRGSIPRWGASFFGV